MSGKDSAIDLTEEAARLEQEIRGFFDTLVEEGVPAMQAMDIMWIQMQDSILDTVNRYIQLGLAIPASVQALVDWAVGAGYATINAQGLYESLLEVEDAAGKVSGAFAEGQQMWTDIIEKGVNLADTLLGLGTELLKTKSTADAQATAWKILGDDIIDVANEYHDMGLELPPLIQAALDYAEALGLVSISSEGVVTATRSMIDVLQEGRNLFDSVGESAVALGDKIYGWALQAIERLGIDMTNTGDVARLQSLAWGLFSDEIVRNTNAIIMNGEAIEDYTYLNLALQYALANGLVVLNKTTGLYEMVKDTVEKVTKEVDNNTKSVAKQLTRYEELREELRALRKEASEVIKDINRLKKAGATASETIIILGKDISSAIEHLKQMGKEVPQVLKLYDALMKLQDAEEVTAELLAVIEELFGPVVAGYIKNSSDAIEAYKAELERLTDLQGDLERMEEQFLKTGEASDEMLEVFRQFGNEEDILGLGEQLQGLRALRGEFTSLREELQKLLPAEEDMFDNFLKTGEVTRELSTKIREAGGDLAAFTEFSGAKKLKDDFDKVFAQFEKTGDITGQTINVLKQFGKEEDILGLIKMASDQDLTLKELMGRSADVRDRVNKIFSDVSRTINEKFTGSIHDTIGEIEDMEDVLTNRMEQVANTIVQEFQKVGAKIEEVMLRIQTAIENTTRFQIELIDQLIKAGAVFPTTSTVPTNTSAFTPYSSRWTPPQSTTTNVQVTATFTPTITIPIEATGTLNTEDLIDLIRDQIEPQLLADLRLNTNQFAQELASEISRVIEE
jgi:archaellum component FlaC